MGYNKSMEEKKIKLNCDAYGKEHVVKKSELDFTDDNGTFYSVCPDVARMYQVVNYYVDTRSNILRHEQMDKKTKTEIVEGLKDDFGSQDFQEKLDRYIDLEFSLLGIPEEYPGLLNQIISAYSSGYYYPAITASGALGERILNRLILKTRDYFKSDSEYKKIHNKKSFDNWDKTISFLERNGVILSEVAKLFKQLEKYRNDSIHYNDGYNFKENSKLAVKNILEIIDKQFNYINRKDLFWVFNVPGEIFVKSEVIDKPFIKEFVLDKCEYITPYHKRESDTFVLNKVAPLAPLSDEEFIKLRKQNK
jgi:uncharacterized protein YutE (UPF0331/DUF86 family)